MPIRRKQVMTVPHDYQTPRTTVRRIPQRGAYDRDTIHQILDEGLVCHVGFAVEGQPYVIPTAYVRRGEQVCLHGAQASRMMRALASGVEACVTVTLLDGLVLARSAFHHSMNYRSVAILGTGMAVEEAGEKIAVLQALSEHIIPGRWRDIRGPNEHELQQTLVVAVPIREASAKIRTGPPRDDEEDYTLPIWAGVLPLRQTPGSPVPDQRLSAGLSAPNYVTGYRGPARL
jgi:nitroimidazol reductase NimA-like FMN-containing flavoprotein (pyridoxamine 5'-phosphate oxidase superfamily)